MTENEQQNLEIERLKIELGVHKTEMVREISQINVKIDKVLEAMALQSENMRPVTETYQTISYLGKWGMKVLVVISIIVGIVISIIKLYKS